MRLLLLCLTFACGSASAADASLFDPSPPQWSYEDSALSDRLKVAPGAKNVIPLTLNRAALRDGVITVSVNNKTYRFVGKVTRHAVTQGLSWSGSNATITRSDISPSDRPTSSTGPSAIHIPGPFFNQLSISVSDGPEGGVYGTLNVDGLYFTIHGVRGTTTVFVVERRKGNLPPAEG